MLYLFTWINLTHVEHTKQVAEQYIFSDLYKTFEACKKCVCIYFLRINYANSERVNTQGGRDFYLADGKRQVKGKDQRSIQS